MATINPTVTEGKGNTYVVKWTGLANGDDGAPVTFPGCPDRSVQIIGTFGSGGTIVIEGALDPESPTYKVLTDPQGNDIQKTVASIETITELTYHIRPRVTGGDGTTALTCILLVRSSL